MDYIPNRDIVEPSEKRPIAGVERVRRRDAYYDVARFFDVGLVLMGMGIVIFWLVGGIGALLLGAIGGQWGWGFGFAWYLPLLAALVVTIAVIGVSMSFLIFSVVRSNE